MSDYIEIGIDLLDYQQNYEWDIMSVPAHRTIRKKYYSSTDYDVEITFSLIIRRKTLFYTFNLIIPLVGVSFLTVLAFYLPSEGAEKITLSTFILVSITFFVLLLYELIPPTSLQVPLIAKYTLFSFVLVSLSLVASVVVLNVHYRSHLTHEMSNWTRILFLNILPKMVLLKTPEFKPEYSSFISTNDYIKAVAIYTFKKRLNYLQESENKCKLEKSKCSYLARVRENKHPRSSFPSASEYQHFLFKKKAVKSVEEIVEYSKKGYEEKRVNTLDETT